MLLSNVDSTVLCQLNYDYVYWPCELVLKIVDIVEIGETKLFTPDGRPLDNTSSHKLDYIAKNSSRQSLF